MSCCSDPEGEDGPKSYPVYGGHHFGGSSRLPGLPRWLLLRLVALLLCGAPSSSSFPLRRAVVVASLFVSVSVFLRVPVCD